MSTPTTSTDTRFNKYNWANAVGYFLNVAVTYGIGASSFSGLPSNSEISAKYQTVVTPAGWAFAIWGIIFLSQLLWVLHQVGAKTKRNSPWVLAVGYNYLFVCLAQVGWTVSFATEQIWISVAMMFAILLFLIKIVQSLIAMPAETSVIKEYFLWKAPFTIHCGWILAASAVNCNLALVAMQGTAKEQLIVAVASLVLLVIAAMYFAPKDSAIPLVIAWGLYGIYAELSSPVDSITNTFSEEQLAIVRNGDLGALVLVLLLVSYYKLVRPFFQRNPSVESEEGAYLRANED